MEFLDIAHSHPYFPRTINRQVIYFVPSCEFEDVNIGLIYLVFLEQFIVKQGGLF
jgi:hypothetical protein